MVSLADVKRWNPGVLEDVLHTVQKHEQILTYSGDDFGTAVNTTMTFTTGCHLTAEATKRGYPAQTY
jgi:hypothetical protein